MRVALDVTPLTLTKAGVARHIAGLLSGLEAEPGLELRRYSFGGSARALVPVRDLGWYLGELPRRAARDRGRRLSAPGDRDRKSVV